MSDNATGSSLPFAPKVPKDFGKGRSHAVAVHELIDTMKQGGLADLHTHLLGMGDDKFWVDLLMCEAIPMIVEYAKHGSIAIEYYLNAKENVTHANWMQAVLANADVFEKKKEEALKKAHAMDRRIAFATDVVYSLEALCIAFGDPYDFQRVEEEAAKAETSEREVMRRNARGEAIQQLQKRLHTKEPLEHLVKHYLVYDARKQDFVHRWGLTNTTVCKQCLPENRHEWKPCFVMDDKKDQQIRRELFLEKFHTEFYPRRYILKDEMYSQYPCVLDMLQLWVLERYRCAGVSHVEFSVGFKDVVGYPWIYRHLAKPRLHSDIAELMCKHQGVSDVSHYNSLRDRINVHFLVGFSREAVPDEYLLWEKHKVIAEEGAFLKKAVQDAATPNDAPFRGHIDKLAVLRKRFELSRKHESTLQEHALHRQVVGLDYLSDEYRRPMCPFWLKDFVDFLSDERGKREGYFGFRYHCGEADTGSNAGFLLAHMALSSAVICEVLDKVQDSYSTPPLRIGHGIAFRHWLVSKGPLESTNEKECRKRIAHMSSERPETVLVAHIGLALHLMKREEIPIELCLTSNDFLEGSAKDANLYTLFTHAGLPVILCTDDDGIWDTERKPFLSVAGEFYGTMNGDLKNICSALEEYDVQTVAREYQRASFAEWKDPVLPDPEEDAGVPSEGSSGRGQGGIVLEDILVGGGGVMAAQWRAVRAALCDVLEERHCKRAKDIAGRWSDFFPRNAFRECEQAGDKPPDASDAHTFLEGLEDRGLLPGSHETDEEKIRKSLGFLLFRLKYMATHASPTFPSSKLQGCLKRFPGVEEAAEQYGGGSGSGAARPLALSVREETKRLPSHKDETTQSEVRNQWTALHKASRYGQLGLVKQLLKRGDAVNARDETGWTPLHTASKHGHLPVVQELLSHSADVHAKDTLGWTPLHTASKWNAAPVMRELLAKGADVNAKATDGWAPLHAASKAGSLSAIEVLVQHGADASCVDGRGRTPAEVLWKKFKGNSTIQVFREPDLATQCGTLELETTGHRAETEAFDIVETKVHVQKLVVKIAADSVQGWTRLSNVHIHSDFLATIVASKNKVWLHEKDNVESNTICWLQDGDTVRVCSGAVRRHRWVPVEVCQQRGFVSIRYLRPSIEIYDVKVFEEAKRSYAGGEHHAEDDNISKFFSPRLRTTILAAGGALLVTLWCKGLVSVQVRVGLMASFSQHVLGVNCHVATTIKCTGLHIIIPSTSVGMVLDHLAAWIPQCEAELNITVEGVDTTNLSIGTDRVERSGGARVESKVIDIVAASVLYHQAGQAALAPLPRADENDLLSGNESPPTPRAAKDALPEKPSIAGRFEEAREWRGSVPGVLLLVAKPVEFACAVDVMDRDRKLVEIADHSISVYIGTLGKCVVALAHTDQGNYSSGTATQEALQLLRERAGGSPKLLLMPGMCGGLRPDKHRFGDIIAASVVVDYEERREAGPRSVDRAKRVEASAAVVGRVNALINKQFSVDVKGLPCRLHSGMMLTGEKLVDSVPVRDELRKRYPDALGVEMEGFGVYRTAHAKALQWMVVKAICDFCGHKNKDHQPLACMASMQVVRKLLSSVYAEDRWRVGEGGGGSAREGSSSGGSDNSVKDQHPPPGSSSAGTSSRGASSASVTGDGNVSVSNNGGPVTFNIGHDTAVEQQQRKEQEELNAALTKVFDDLKALTFRPHQDFLLDIRQRHWGSSQCPDLGEWLVAAENERDRGRTNIMPFDGQRDSDARDLRAAIEAVGDVLDPLRPWMGADKRNSKVAYRPIKEKLGQNKSRREALWQAGYVLRTLPRANNYERELGDALAQWT